MTLIQLQQCVQAIYPAAIYPANYSATVDTSGNATINLWNNAIGVQPTAAQLTAQLAAMQLAQAQTAQTAVLTAAYTTARYGTPVSLASGSPATTLSFPTDTLTQSNIMGYLVAFTAANAPAQMPLQDASGNVQMLTYAQLQTLAQSMATQSMTAWQTLQGLITQVLAATTVAAVQAIVWPVT
jgi:hypothetical protein